MLDLERLKQKLIECLRHWVGDKDAQILAEDIKEIIENEEENNEQ